MSQQLKALEKASGELVEHWGWLKSEQPVGTVKSTHIPFLEELTQSLGKLEKRWRVEIEEESSKLCEERGRLQPDQDAAEVAKELLLEREQALQQGMKQLAADKAALNSQRFNLNRRMNELGAWEQKLMGTAGELVKGKVVNEAQAKSLETLLAEFQITSRETRETLDEIKARENVGLQRELDESREQEAELKREVQRLGQELKDKADAKLQEDWLAEKTRSERLVGELSACQRACDQHQTRRDETLVELCAAQNDLQKAKKELEEVEQLNEEWEEYAKGWEEDLGSERSGSVVEAGSAADGTQDLDNGSAVGPSDAAGAEAVGAEVVGAEVVGAEVVGAEAAVGDDQGVNPLKRSVFTPEGTDSRNRSGVNPATPHRPSKRSKEDRQGGEGLRWDIAWRNLASAVQRMRPAPGNVLTGPELDVIFRGIVNASTSPGNVHTNLMVFNGSGASDYWYCFDQICERGHNSWDVFFDDGEKCAKHGDGPCLQVKVVAGPEKGWEGRFFWRYTA